MFVAQEKKNKKIKQNQKLITIMNKANSKVESFLELHEKNNVEPFHLVISP